MKRIIFLLISFPLVLMSCFTFPEVKRVYSNPAFKKIIDKDYNLNVKKKCTVGNDMIVIQPYRQAIQQVYILNRTLQPPSYGWIGVQIDTIIKDTKFYKYGTIDTNIIIYNKKPISEKIRTDWGFIMDKTGLIQKDIIVLGYKPEQENKSIEWIKEKLFDPGFDTALYQSDYKYKLTYNGKSGNTIKISYREFYKNMARDAFNKELEYNLDESKNISFKSLDIEVIEATNSYIEYTIKSDGDLPWAE